MARTLIITPRFDRDYRRVGGHPDFDRETVIHIFDLLIAGGPLPEWCDEHPLEKRGINWAGRWDCHVGPDLVMIYRQNEETVWMQRIGGHVTVFGTHKRA